MKFAIFLLATLAIVNFSSASLPVGHAQSLSKQQQPDAYYPALHTVVQGEDNEQSDENSSSSSSSSEEDEATTTVAATKSRLSYRRGGRPSHGSGVDGEEHHRRYRTRSQPETRSANYVGESRQKPRRVYDYGNYDNRRSDGGQSANRLQLKNGQYVQYGNEQRWAIYPRYRDQQESESVQKQSRRHPAQTTESETATPTKLPPRLLLKSGDNVHFGEGINWSIYKTDSGLTRVGTRDGEVVVRVVRPSYEDYQRRRTEPPTAPTTEAPITTTPYQWQWQPCHNEQDCYRQYVNEYYRFYSHHQ